MRRILRLLPLAAVIVALSSCGGSSSTTTHNAPQPHHTEACPPNNSFMGCSVKTNPHGFQLTKPAGVPGGLLFPDVSDWQGHPGWGSVAAWQRAHGWHPYAIFKIGEYTLDPDAGYNASETSRLGFYRAGYWFVRPTGCSHEAGLILWAAQRYGLKVVDLDEEVGGIAGYASCLSAPLERSGLIVVLYTAPGVWGGGSTAGLDEWVASYGPSHPPCFVTCHVGLGAHPSILAWQFTDGVYGSPVTVPGIGRDDVSVSYGIDRLGVGPPPPPPDPLHYRVLTPTELQWALRYDGARQHAKYDVYRRDVLQPELVKLAHTIWVVAHARGQGGWTIRNRGERFQLVYRRSLGQRLA